MEEWKEYKIGEIAQTNVSQYSLSENWQIIQYLDTGSITMNQISNIGLFNGNEGLPSRARRKVKKGDIIFSAVRPNLCHYGYMDNPPSNLLVSTGFVVITVNAKIVDSRFLYYYLTQNDIVNHLHAIGEQAVSTYPTIRPSDIEDLSVFLPPLYEQKRISSILYSLDSKISCNSRINDNLQHQANTLFKSWFVDFEPFRNGEFAEAEMGMIPKGWQVVSLISIAKYLNGLAMQNFRPEENDKGLPVLKIKELGQGMSDSSSDRCSSDIAKQYIVNDGDVIFSWSGTLLVDLWCGGQCGLNQHLFKVTSSYYPKWFYYMWTKQHLNNFIQIAKDKAVTMGHIKRGHLEEAKVLVPTETAMNAMTAIMQPIIDEIIDSRIESRRLSQLRDALLPRLMSGELKVDSLTDE